MTLFEVLIVLAILAIVGFQVYLTVRVFRSRMYEQKQKVWQAQLIWLLPIIGAGLVFTILQEDDKAQRSASSHLKGPANAESRLKRPANAESRHRPKS